MSSSDKPDPEPGEKAHAHPKPARGQTLVLIGLSALGVFAVLFLGGFLIRHLRLKHREAMAREIRNQPPVVQVTRPTKTQQSFELALPADVRAFATTSLYARTDGYLASWKYDLGARVKKGDVLAVISAPDTDAQLEQARATLSQQITARHLAEVTEQRYRGLISIHGVTQEQLDQVRSNREQAGANVAAAAAAVDRLKALVGFEKIVAPFDGVVTGRTYDIGALITASATGSGQELFDLAADDTLRVFVSVPQAYSLLLKYGQPVFLTLERNYPAHRFKGIVARSAGALDPVTRTLRTELDFKNDDPVGKILPGMYAEAIFPIHRDQPVLTIPTSALLFEAEGKEVAIVQDGDKIHLQKVVPGRDFGTTMEIISGLKDDDQIVANPGEELAEGVKVEVRTEGAENGGSAGSQSSAGSPPK